MWIGKGTEILVFALKMGWIKGMGGMQG